MQAMISSSGTSENETRPINVTIRLEQRSNPAGDRPTLLIDRRPLQLIWVGDIDVSAARLNHLTLGLKHPRNN